MARLVLSRREGEKVLVSTRDGDVLITVIEAGGVVKLAFDGPKTIPINREEIARQKGMML